LTRFESARQPGRPDACRRDPAATWPATTRSLCAGRCHVELTTLLIPDENDSEDEVRALSQWVASISPEIPLHMTRYYPNYRMEIPQMERERLFRLADIARERLEHVYCGNV